MLLRRITALTCGVLLALTLTSCGREAATGRDYTPAAGANTKDGEIDVLGAVIVSEEPRKGTFIASLVNNTDSRARLLEVTSAEPGQASAEEFTSVPIGGNELVNLAEDPSIVISGDFEAGNYVKLAFTFSNGETIPLSVPVVRNDGIWADLDVSGEKD